MYPIECTECKLIIPIRLSENVFTKTDTVSVFTNKTVECTLG